MRELLEEMGEDKGSGGGVLLPRGPLGMVSTLAAGVVAASSLALVYLGDVADYCIFSTPLGAPVSPMFAPLDTPVSPMLSPLDAGAYTQRPSISPGALMFKVAVRLVLCIYGQGFKPFF